MSTECCSSSPRLDYDQFLNDITWLNEDYPEANMALLDGIRNGMTGYGVDKIIENQSKKRSNYGGRSDKDHNVAKPKRDNSCPNFETMEKVLQETSAPSPLPQTTNIDPNDTTNTGNSTTVRPKSIGEERKAWLLEARRACCLNELQNNRFLNSASEMFYRNSTAYKMQQLASANLITEQMSVSCPDLEILRRETVQQYECKNNSGRFISKEARHDKDKSTRSIDEKDSCEFLFQHVEGCFKPSKIRLSPRIEKLDKLIPKTSKEFLNTMRIVSTISPQPSEEQLNSLPCMHSVKDNMKSNANNETTHRTGNSDEFEENLVGLEHQPCSDAESAVNKFAGMVCRSYKEVCIYGPHSSSGANSSSHPCDQIQEKVLNENIRANYPQSVSGFPSLPKLVKSSDGTVGEELQKSAPPLYSSILQRSPTCTNGCGDTNCGDHQHHNAHQAAKIKGKASPIAQSAQSSSPPALGSFDCGFCRTNNEPESVYRSHPLRMNDVVVCPSLRKYVCCFCGATGDKAHTIKYCPKNPIGFFAKKSRNSPVLGQATPGEKNTCKGLSTGNEQSTQQGQLSPVKGKECKNVLASKEYPIQADQEPKSVSDTEVVIASEEPCEPLTRSLGNWIEAKPKGRKKKVENKIMNLKYGCIVKSKQ